jgi:quinol monooxygenase YgiN
MRHWADADLVRTQLTITGRNLIMTTISKHNKLSTLINVFTVEPARQQELLDLLARATQIVRLEPGFVSANLHRSIDGSKVTMYAQWRSIEDYQAMRENPAPLPYFEQAISFARFEPGMYEVVETYCPPPNEA